MKLALLKKPSFSGSPGVHVTWVFFVLMRMPTLYMVLYCDDWCFDPYSHHDKKTFEFKADPARNNVGSNSRGYFAIKNLRSGGHATISATGNCKIRTPWNATKSVANALTTVGKRTVNSPFFSFSFSRVFAQFPL